MDLRARLDVFSDTDELCKLLYNRTRTSPDELLMECRDSLLGMFSDLHDAADEIERLRKDAEMYKKIMRELHSVGRYLPSEDELIRQGVRFGDYERGVNDTLAAIDAAIRNGGK